MTKEKGSNAMFWGFVLGAIGGAAFTLLRTPRSGREIRGEISSQASRLTSRGQQTATDAWQTAGKTAESAWQQAADVTKTAQQQASGTADALQQQAGDLAESAQEQAVDVAASAEDAVSEAADDLTGS